MNYDKIYVPNIKYLKPLKDDSCYIAYAKYDNRELVTFTPILKCINVTHNHKLNRWEIEFELTKKDKAFYEVLASIEDYDINVVHANSEEWFGQQFPFELVEEYQKPFVKLRNKQLKIKIAMNEGIACKKKDFVGKYYIATMRYIGLQFMKQTFTSFWIVDKLEHRSYNDYDKFDFNNDEGMVMFDKLEKEEEIAEKEPEIVIEIQKEEVVAKEEEVAELVKEEEKVVELVKNEEVVKEEEAVVAKEENEVNVEEKKEVAVAEEEIKVIEVKKKKKKFKTLKGIR